MTAIDRSQLAFTGVSLDRVSVERKDPEWVARMAASPPARLVATGRDGVLISDDGRAVARFAPRDGELGPDAILLGVADDGEVLFASDLDSEPREGPRLGLRAAGAGALPHAEAGLAAYATALLNWHRTHLFCARCGGPTTILEAGYSRRCTRCGAHHFPRTDPVVIMSVEYDGRLLLGRRDGWPAGRVSCLAGFVSPGESAEEAVVREVQEESGIVVRDPLFRASQAWPFPASLMLGFHAVCDGGEPRATDGELAEVGWYPREDVARSARGEPAGFHLPDADAIARFLIDTWLAEQA